jgi:hypothetical protein
MACWTFLASRPLDPVLAATLAFFYSLGHVLMRAQGLPLNWNMALGN